MRRVSSSRGNPRYTNRHIHGSQHAGGSRAREAPDPAPPSSSVYQCEIDTAIASTAHYQHPFGASRFTPAASAALPYTSRLGRTSMAYPPNVPQLHLHSTPPVQSEATAQQSRQLDEQQHELSSQLEALR